MSKEIKMNQKALKHWAKNQVDQFFRNFSDPEKAYNTAKNYILQVWADSYYSYAELPKLVSDTVKYTIGAFNEKNKFIITLMNPKTGAFGKAVICKKDYHNFSWEYSLALAWARMNNKDYAVLEDETTLDKVSTGQHFMMNEKEYVFVHKTGAGFYTYCITDKKVEFFAFYQAAIYKIKILY